MGAHELVVEAWTDRYATWAHKTAIKLDAAQDVSAEVAEAVLMVSGLVGDGNAPEKLRARWRWLVIGPGGAPRYRS